jgi:tetratricopeptide (TPR) repeat protein
MPEDQIPTTERVAGGYELIEEIGHGGMGVVYRAHDTALDREVAVKLLSGRLLADPAAAERFVNEAHITGKLQHPGIPAVHQVGTLADGRPFLAMKLINGSTLEAILKQRRDLLAERGRMLTIFEDVCQAVGYAHAHRVIHRDLKPANVMVGAFGEVQVMDWGLAKVLGEPTPVTAQALETAETRLSEFNATPVPGSHTKAGSMVGTPAFIAPEQALGEIGRVNERSDVFGLGAVLAVILTGQPPYVGETFESLRVQAVRGNLQACFARLDGSGATPEFVALCKQCLAFDPADRPADAGAVAQTVAGLRAAADERARRAELEQVRMEGEQATVLARAAEQRKRRRLVIGAAAVLALAVVGGLTAVLAVERQDNAALAVNNKALANQEAEAQERFETALKAIAALHTGVSEDFLLKNAKFKELRTKLLKEAANFYTKLEKLLTGKTDARSRKLLADSYFQLGELTWKIGDHKEALAVHRKALALRRELAELPGADVEARLDVARSLQMVGRLLFSTGELAGALSALEEMRQRAEALEKEAPTDAVRTQLALAHDKIGRVLYEMGKKAKALTEDHKALDIREKLAKANPTNAEYQTDLARSHDNIGDALSETGKPADALQEYQQAMDIRQKLANKNPDARLRSELAWSHQKIGHVFDKIGKPAKAQDEYREALKIRKELATDNDAVTRRQSYLAGAYIDIGTTMRGTGSSKQALAWFNDALTISKKLVDDNGDVLEFKHKLAISYDGIGGCLLDTGKPVEAATMCSKASEIVQELVKDHTTITRYRLDLVIIQNKLGRALYRHERLAEAFTALQKGLEQAQKLVNAEPENPFYNEALGHSYACRGGARVRARQPAEAAADLRHALESWGKLPPPFIVDQVEQSRSLALLAGLGGDAKSGVSKGEAKAFADQSVAALAAAFKTGWDAPSELKEPDFDAIRGRDDFKKLLAELEAKSVPKAEPKD